MNWFFQFFATTFKDIRRGKYVEQIPSVLPIGLIVDISTLSDMGSKPCPECGSHTLFIEEIRIDPQWDSAEEFHKQLAKGNLTIGGRFRLACDYAICDFFQEQFIPVERFRDRIPAHLSQRLDIAEEDYSTVIIEQELNEEESLEMRKELEEKGGNIIPMPPEMLN